MNNDTSLELLSIQSGLPAYLLTTLERMGLIDVSHYEIADSDKKSSILQRAKHVLDLRQIGFTLEQIAALLDAEDSQQTAEAIHA